jgi:hypothetical protein
VGHEPSERIHIGMTALVFGRQLSRDQVALRGITDVTGREVARAASAGGRLRPIATLAFSGPGQDEDHDRQGAARGAAYR